MADKPHCSAGARGRLLFAILAASLVLAACFPGGRRGTDGVPAIHDFGPSPAPLPVARRIVPLALEIRAPQWFDSMGIDYRLAYADASRLREYTRARWAGPPAQLMQQYLGQRLGTLPAGLGRAPCLLRVEIGEFSQIFTTPESSTGVLHGRAVLFDAARRPLAVRQLQIETPAASPDSRGGVAALTASVERMAADLADWERAQAAAHPAAACWSEGAGAR